MRAVRRRARDFTTSNTLTHTTTKPTTADSHVAQCKCGVDGEATAACGGGAAVAELAAGDSGDGDALPTAANVIGANACNGAQLARCAAQCDGDAAQVTMCACQSDGSAEAVCASGERPAAVSSGAEPALRSRHHRALVLNAAAAAALVLVSALH